MEKVPATKVVTSVQATESPLPPRMQEALGELVGAAREGLLALSVDVGEREAGGDRDVPGLTRAAVLMQHRPRDLELKQPPQGGVSSRQFLVAVLGRRQQPVVSSEPGVARLPPREAPFSKGEPKKDPVRPGRKSGEPTAPRRSGGSRPCR